MSEIYNTSTDILYLILTIVIALLGIMLIMAAYHLVKILRNVNKVSQKASDTMDLLNHYLWQPIKIALMAFDKIKHFTKKKSD